MPLISIKNRKVESPNEVRSFENGRAELVNLEDSPFYE
ncbi:hypothetical protein HRbin01_01225 [archaeon HR01]|nr:hypothetical protein HRbin01_01225 [archaeon HR01]